MGLKDDILRASKQRGINPYTQPFKPCELGLDSSKYGSFSDYCPKKKTKSAKWNKEEILEPVEYKKNKQPLRYVLIK
jgi:hypothetical protein